MKKYEEINKIVSEFSDYFETLGTKERQDSIELARMICQFRIEPNDDGTLFLDIVYGMTTTFKGNFKKNEAVFIYALFTGLIELEYQFRARRRNLKLEVAKEIDKYIQMLNFLIKDLALDEKLEPVRDFNCDEFFEELKQVVVDKRKEKIKLLEEHKANNIEQIRLINSIYDKFHVISTCILFFDPIDRTNKTYGKSDSRKLQYAIFVIFKHVYTQTALWMSQKSVMYWESVPAWQLVEDFELLIRKHFLKTR